MAPEPIELTAARDALPSRHGDLELERNNCFSGYKCVNTHTKSRREMKDAASFDLGNRVLHFYIEVGSHPNKKKIGGKGFTSNIEAAVCYARYKAGLPEQQAAVGGGAMAPAADIGREASEASDASEASEMELDLEETAKSGSLARTSSRGPIRQREPEVTTRRSKARRGTHISHFQEEHVGSAMSDSWNAAEPGEPLHCSIVAAPDDPAAEMPGAPAGEEPAEEVQVEVVELVEAPSAADRKAEWEKCKGDRAIADEEFKGADAQVAAADKAVAEARARQASALEAKTVAAQAQSAAVQVESAALARFKEALEREAAAVEAEETAALAAKAAAEETLGAVAAKKSALAEARRELCGVAAA